VQRVRLWAAVSLAAVGALATAGCVTTAPPARSPGAGAVVVDGVPALDYGIDRCAAGALASVLGYWGRAVDIEELVAELPVVGNGVLSVDLLIEARERGFNARLVEGSPEYLEEAIRQGEPLILMLRVVNAPGGKRDLYHYVVVDGVDSANGLVRVHFGKGSASWGKLAKVRRAWKATDNFVLHLRPAVEID
jgi:ABC-type bacteriocin/lantibiotic exporter with double-glycine peptidase domain